MLFEKDINI